MHMLCRIFDKFKAYPGEYYTKFSTGEAPPRGPAPALPFCTAFWQKRYPVVYL